MIIEDRYGNIYEVPNIPQQYQAGGLVLPQYSASEVTLQTPQSNLLNIPVNNDWGRGMQMDQLNMQREAAAFNTANTIVNNSFRRQTEQRLNKQMDLQNKRMEWDQLQAGAKEIERMLLADKDLFLQGDQEAVQKILDDAGAGKNNIGNLNPSDVNSIFKTGAIQRSILSSQKQAHANKANFMETGKVLEEVEKNLLRAEKISELGYLNEDAQTALQTAGINLAKKRSELANGTLKNWDIYSDPDYMVASNAVNFIDKGEQDLIFKTKQDQAKSKIAVDQANVAVDLANAENILGTMDARKAQMQADAKLNAAKTEALLAMLPGEVAKLKSDVSIANSDNEIKTKLNDLFMSTYNQYKVENPDAEATDIARFVNELKGKIYGDAKVDPISSMNELLARTLQAEGASAEEIIAANQGLNTSTKNSAVTYKYDGLGNKVGVIKAGGVVDYGGYQTLNDKFLSGNYGGKKIEAKYIEEELKNNDVILEADGAIRIKTNATVMKIFGITGTATWNPLTGWDSQDIEEAIPGAEKKGSYWVIPADKIAIPESTQTPGAPGTPFFNQAPAPTPGISPNNPFND